MKKMFDEIFEKNKSKKKVRCIICQCWLPSNSDQVKASHVNGKSHKQKCDFKEKQNQLLKQSVYVKGFDPLTANLESRLQELFQELGGGGEVEDVYIDKNSAKYCFIKYKCESSVAKALSNSQNVLLDGKKLCIKPRMSSPSTLETSKKKGKSVLQKNPSIHGSSIQTLIDDILKTLSLKDQMSLLKEKFGLSKSDMQIRTLICELMQSILEEAYPYCQVKLFGSSTNGLGSKGCDLDVTVISSQLVEDCEDSSVVLKEMRELLERFAPGFKNIFLVESQKNCSIIKMYHTDSELNVDLSLNNRLAISNTELLKAYICQDETIQSFIFTLRAWAKMNSLIGRNAGQLTNYALTLMIICFLQQQHPPYLTCLQDRLGNESNKEMIGPWNCWFDNEHSPVKTNIEDPGLVLIKFFKFAGESFLNPNIIAIHTLKTLQKYELDPELTRSAFMTQDPIKLSHNVTQNITQNGLQTLHQVVTKTLGRLEKLETLKLHDLLQKDSNQNANKKSSHVLVSTRPSTTDDEKPAKVVTQPSPKKKLSRDLVIDLPQTRQEQKSDYIIIIKTLLKEDLKFKIDDCSATVKEEGLTRPESETSNKKRKFMEDCSPSQPDLKKAKTMMNIETVNSDRPRDEHNSNKKMNEIRNSTENIESTITKDVNGEAKADMEEDVEFTGIAYHETWTSRRKQRRMMDHLAAKRMSSETSEDRNQEKIEENSQKIEENSQNISIDVSDGNLRNIGETSSFENTPTKDNVDDNVTVPKTASSTDYQHVSNEIKLSIRFKIAVVVNCPERLTMTLLYGDIKTFQMFFAYFKKKLINSLTVG